jgi:hypothetical protein
MENIKLGSGSCDSGSKKRKRGYNADDGGVWRNLRLKGVWSQAVGFVLVRSVAVKMFYIFKLVCKEIVYVLYYYQCDL